MSIQSFADVMQILPELFLSVSAMVLLVLGVMMGERSTRLVSTLAVVSFAVTLFLISKQQGAGALHFTDMFVTDDFTRFGKSLVLLAASLTLALAFDWLDRDGNRHFEYPVLMMLSVTGLMLMISAADLLAVYMGLELSSLALYVLAAYRRDDVRSTEAGLKYFVLGSLSSGMMLFGMSLIYGFTGTISFAGLANVTQQLAVPATQLTAFPYGVVMGAVMLLIGFCFKISAVPFHMWTPDVYEGSPTPVTAFFATAPKVAMLFVMLRVLALPLLALSQYWQQVIIFMSVGSMLVGSLGALVQTNIKRLLAYSSIGHVGYALVGLAAGGEAGIRGVIIYIALYIFMSVGAFGCVLMMRRNGEYVEQISDLAGLVRRNSKAALALSIFMFSMAGIPPLAGFFGKMYIFVSAVHAGLIGLAVIGVLTSVIACFYYLKVVKVMYFDAPSEDVAFDKADALLPAIIGLCFAITVCFVLKPDVLISSATIATKALL